MAELELAPASGCCAPAEQEVCCEPRDKASCCGERHGDGCGCGAAEPSAAQGLRERVREHYAAAAVAASGGSEQLALGCGNPTAVAELREGETVLDLGSGAGGDLLRSARRVGSTGRAIGLDMTDQMLDLARRNQVRAGIENAEFVNGTIESVPLPDDSVDVIISNCVVNLSTDKPRAFREAARVLRPGGRLAISDVVAGPDMDDATRSDLRLWTGCIAGALTREEFTRELAAAGFESIEIEETHPVHERAAAAIIRARLQ